MTSLRRRCKTPQDAYLWLNGHSPERAGEWYEELLEAIFSLENFPLRCPVAPESAEFGREIRQLHYRKRGQMHRILFDIGHDESTGEDVVRIYRIWPGARRKIRLDEFLEGKSQDDE